MSEEDMDFKEDLGTPQERKKILSALREWADSQPDQNMPLYITAIDINLSAGEIISHIEDETAIGIAVLDVLALEARKLKILTRSEVIKFLGRQFPRTNFRDIGEE